MKVTIDGITYEGTEDEIRRIVENPPRRRLDDWGDQDCFGIQPPVYPYKVYPPIYEPTPTPIPCTPHAYPYVTCAIF